MKTKIVIMHTYGMHHLPDPEKDDLRHRASLYEEEVEKMLLSKWPNATVKIRGLLGDQGPRTKVTGAADNAAMEHAVSDAISEHFNDWFCKAMQ